MENKQKYSKEEWFEKMDVDVITYNLEFQAAHKNEKDKITNCKYCGRCCIDDKCICGKKSQSWNLKKCEGEDECEDENEDIIIPMTKEENDKFQKEVTEFHDLKNLKQICKNNPEVKKEVIKFLKVAFMTGVIFKNLENLNFLLESWDKYLTE